jgi:hypothetical protein
MRYNASLRYDCMIYNMMTINNPYITSSPGHRSLVSGTSRLSKRGNPLPLEWPSEEPKTTT